MREYPIAGQTGNDHNLPEPKRIRESNGEEGQSVCQPPTHYKELLRTRTKVVIVVVVDDDSME